MHGHGTHRLPCCCIDTRLLLDHKANCCRVLNRFRSSDPCLCIFSDPSFLSLRFHNFFSYQIGVLFYHIRKINHLHFNGLAYLLSWLIWPEDLNKTIGISSCGVVENFFLLGQVKSIQYSYGLLIIDWLEMLMNLRILVSYMMSSIIMEFSTCFYAISTV